MRSEVRFDDIRWTERPQVAQWRHSAALALVERSPILDVGGGDGLFGAMLADAGFQVTIADHSNVGLAAAAARGLSVTKLDLDAPLPFADGAFETVCALDVLEHVRYPVETLRELGRVGRAVVLTVPNFNFWRDRLAVSLGRVPFQMKPARGHVYWFNLDVLSEVIEEAGLTVDVTDFESTQRPTVRRIARALARRRPNLFTPAVAVRTARTQSLDVE